MLRRLQHKASGHTRDVTILRAPAEGLPFDNGSFDVAVSTLVLCGVDDQPRALRELRRVLRPGGLRRPGQPVAALDLAGPGAGAAVESGLGDLLGSCLGGTGARRLMRSPARRMRSGLGLPGW